MKLFKGIDGVEAVILSLCVAATGCHTTSRSAYRTNPSMTVEPSGGGTTVAAESPGAGVGAQTSAGAAADVSEATQKGAGASELTKHEESAANANAEATQPPPGSTQTSTTFNQASSNVAIPLYQESLQVGKREVNDGAVRIRKYVTTETVNQPVELRTEQVTIDRLAPGSQADQTAASQSQSQAFQPQDFVIQLHREEPVVAKQVTRQGEIVAQVQTQTQQTNIQAQVRRDQVQVTKQGNPQNVVISENVGSSSATAGSAVGGGGEVGGQSQGASAGGGAIADASELTAASDPASLAGRKAKLSGLKVQQIIGDHLVAVTDASGKTLYARVDQLPPDLKQGDTVNLTGTVNSMPSTPATLGLSDEANQALKDQKIYLDAKKVQVTNQ